MTAPRQQIEVDLLALQQSKEGIATNTEAALQPGITSARRMIYRGVPVGEQSRSGEVDASRQAMAYAMHCFWKNSEAYMERASRVTEFLTRVLEEYRTADDLAKLDVDAVTDRLREMMRRTLPPPAAPTRGEFA
ncbi:MAG TPA: hypothetical protein VFC19_09585 [Candidatus Limnocylindrales bacterium]|nr:hypothetical protein [Candidatus Limnocylindrales bacterium]